MSKKISELTQATSVTGNEMIPFEMSDANGYLKAELLASKAYVDSEFDDIEAIVDAINGSYEGGDVTTTETDPTVPSYVKAITEENIAAWTAKQDAISDLESIRSGAAAGATALQSHQDISGKQDVISDLDAIRSGAAAGATALQSHQDISGKVDKETGKGLSTNDYTTAEKDKLAAIEDYTIGEGLTVENGVLKCSFVPTRYYTGSSDPIDTSGNNGDLYLQITS